MSPPASRPRSRPTGWQVERGARAGGGPRRGRAAQGVGRAGGGCHRPAHPPTRLAGRARPQAQTSSRRCICSRHIYRTFPVGLVHKNSGRRFCSACSLVCGRDHRPVLACGRDRRRPPPQAQTNCTHSRSSPQNQLQALLQPPGPVHLQLRRFGVLLRRSRPQAQTNCKHFCGLLGPYIYSCGALASSSDGLVHRLKRTASTSAASWVRTFTAAALWCPPQTVHRRGQAGRRVGEGGGGRGRNGAAWASSSRGLTQRIGG